MIHQGLTVLLLRLPLDGISNVFYIFVAVENVPGSPVPKNGLWLALSSSFPAAPNYPNILALLPCLSIFSSMQVRNFSHFVCHLVTCAYFQSQKLHNMSSIPDIWILVPLYKARSYMS